MLSGLTLQSVSYPTLVDRAYLLDIIWLRANWIWATDALIHRSTSGLRSLPALYLPAVILLQHTRGHLWPSLLKLQKRFLCQRLHPLMVVHCLPR